MRLSLDQRLRIINLYHKHDLQFTKNKFNCLSELAAKEDILITSRGLVNLVNKWHKTGSVADRPSENRDIKNTKLSGANIN